jgi:hypothetical protein
MKVLIEFEEGEEIDVPQIEKQLDKRFLYGTFQVR